MTAGKTGGAVRRISNLQARILTGLFLGVVSLGVSWVGGWAFSLFSIAIGGGVFYEWNRLALPLQNRLITACGWLCYAAVCAALLFAFPVRDVFLIVLAGVAALLFSAGRHAGWLTGGFIYAALFVITLSILRGHEIYGFVNVCFLYAVVWGTDIGAYFCGRMLGGPKLAPALSPKKTWSGALGGAVIGIGAGIGVAMLLLDPGKVNFALFALALLLSVASQIGDLGESGLKRHFGVKDSGTVLPGHGGIMDRVDGLIAASLALYLAGIAVAGADMPANLFYFL